MKTSKMIKLSLVLAVTVFISSLAGYICGVRANHDVEKKNSESKVSVKGTFQKNEVIEDSGKKEEETVGETYILKSKGSGVSLYLKKTDGTEKLYKSYDIPVRFLPKSDREALKKGIEFNSIDDVLQLIEDYL